MQPSEKTSADFPTEPPTLVNSPASRLAKLARDWRECTLAQQRTLERIAAKLAALPRVKP